jgi:hypothetical protein
MASKEDKPAQELDRDDSASAVSVPIHLGLPVTVSGGPMEYYLVPKERIENLRLGTDLGESRTYGFSVGVCLTIMGILISHYLSGQPAPKLIPFLWSALSAFVALAVYLYRKDKKIKAKRESDFSEILNATKAITMPPVLTSDDPMPDPSDKNFLRAKIQQHRDAH